MQQADYFNAFQQSPPIDPKRLRQRMVREQISARGITNTGILTAMQSVPRHLFVPETYFAHAYDDSALPIGYGQTISQPYMVALMTHLLELEPGQKVLEVGAGCGYQAAIIAAMGCTVHAIERLPELYRATLVRMRNMGFRNVHIIRGDGTLGFPQAAPYDRIVVSAGGPVVPPPLVDQLADDGVLVIPVGARPRTQRLMRLRKHRGNVVGEDMGPAIFVDLVGDHGW